MVGIYKSLKGFVFPPFQKNPSSERGRAEKKNKTRTYNGGGIRVFFWVEKENGKVKKKT